MSGSSVAAEQRPRAVVVIAASTGGPNALARVLGGLPAPLGAAVLIAQHMPAGFTASLARRLDALCALPVREATHGEALVEDRVYLAPGGSHLRIYEMDAALRASVEMGAPVWGVRPAADVLFVSAARVCGEAIVGVVLTGMGRDGAEGLRAVRAAGGQALVQDRESCVVFGMPYAALSLAGADRVAPLHALPGLIVDAVGRVRAPARVHA